MKFRLESLALTFRRGQSVIPFKDISYFWGQMGAGKTSIARLIDYCLGADLELTPAMQSEFVSATLHLTLQRGQLALERVRDSDSIVASWGNGDDAYQLSLPAREGEGELLTGTGVENLSDLIFWLSDLVPPRVRKSKFKPDSPTKRLSFRNLFWYCYLDQDEIDSSFFHLGERDHPFKKLDSRDVIRYVIGFHDERVAELEALLDQLRGERHALTASVTALTNALKDVGVDSELQIQSKVQALEGQARNLQLELAAIRASSSEAQTKHAILKLRAEARALDEQLQEVTASDVHLRAALDREKRHLHEIETLSLKFRRSISAKTVLADVEFAACPKCTQSLPAHAEGTCGVCGQPDSAESTDAGQLAVIEKDAKARLAELKEIITKHEEALKRIARTLEEISIRRNRVERERNEAESSFDSAYLSTALAKEHERAAILQDSRNLASLARLPQMLERQKDQISEIVAKEARLKGEAKEAREKAEGDETKLSDLKDLFLDCLLRAGVPGIAASDLVDIPKDSFFAMVESPGDEQATITSFATLSSGGKKTLFKCCFAIAVHRLARRTGAPLPELLIVDSPMKNISERENREQFEGFYRLLYELAGAELRDTQLVLIDKEYSSPADGTTLDLVVRHMRPGDPECPPLIPYYLQK